VLVPTERHAELEAARGAHVLTLRELASRLSAASSPTLRPATLETTRLLTRLVLAQQTPALALAVDEAVGQLRRSGARLEDLRAIQTPRAALLARALARTDSRLRELGLRDEREEADLAARSLAEVSIPELDGVARARVRGMSRWENAELLLLEALHHRLRASGGSGLVVELPAVHAANGAVLREAISSSAARLEERWAAAADAPELEFVEAASAGEAPLVIRAAHESSEARAVAHAVLQALARGASLDRIAIVPLEPSEAFLDPLRAELVQAGIPFSDPWGRPIGSAPEAHAALELMRLARGPVLRDTLVDVLRVPDLRLTQLVGAEIPSPHFIDQLARLPVRVDRTGEELLAAVASRLSRSDPDDERAREALSTTERVLRALFARFTTLATAHTRRGFRDAWRQLFAELGLLSASSKGLALAIAAGDARDLSPLGALGQNARARRAIEQSLERVAEAGAALGLGDAPLDLAEFLDEFANALGAANPGLGAERAGALRVARASEVAGLDWDLLVVCRAASSSLDWQASGADGVLDADLLERLPRRIRPPDSRERAMFTRLGLASALSRSKQAVFTWAKRDASGHSGESRLLLSLLDRTERDEPASPLDPGAHRVTPAARASEEVRARATLEIRRQDFYADPDAEPDFQNGLAGPLARLVGGEAERPIALTQIERYARCGFLGFSGSVLRAVRDEIVGDGLNARERGTLIHEALAVALSGSRARFGSADLAELEQEAIERAAEFLRTHTSSNLRAAALAAALDDVAALLRWSFANADGIWFAEAERGFGSGSEWSALPVGEHFVSGRIDRIDSNSDGSVVRIIDYKTGKVQLGGVHGELLLQPWLYAKKVAEQYGAKRVSSGYLTLQRRKPEWKSALPETQPESEAIHEKLVRADELIRALRGGRVVARPALPSSCGQCDARDICRRPLSAPHEGGE